MPTPFVTLIIQSTGSGGRAERRLIPEKCKPYSRPRLPDPTTGAGARRRLREPAPVLLPGRAQPHPKTT